MVSTVEPFVTAESIFHISAEHKSGYTFDADGILEF